MKKILCAMLAAVSALPLFGCGSSRTQPDVTPAPAVETAPVYDYGNQRELIESFLTSVNPLDPYDQWFYTVTDLDHNGRLELTVASCRGTGLYTTADYYEVSENLDSVVACPTDYTEGDSWPDIIADSADCYRDASTGRYYYVFEDTVRNGAAEYWIYTTAVCLENGRVGRTQTASRHVLYSEDGTPEITCTDSDGNIISQEQYDSAADSFFTGLDKSITDFEWIQFDNEEVDIPREPALIFAEDLYDGYGYFHQLCDETGVYDFAPVNSDGVAWQVYILEDEFADAERFIPQACALALEGSGSLSIKEGQWIYIYCPCNQWTMQTAPEGCAFSWGINPDLQYGDAPVPQTALSGAAPVITKNPTSEAITVGGKNWFIAYADGADSVDWQFINPADGRAYSPEQAEALNPGLNTEISEGTTLMIENVPLSLNGWSVQAVFYGGGAKSSTEPASIYVGDFVGAYQSVIDAYGSLTPSETVSEMVAYGKHAGYALKDLDKDGTPELIIAGMEMEEGLENLVYDLYTLQGGNPVQLAQSRARSRYYIMNDSRIFNQGSNGATSPVNNVYRIKNFSLVLEEELSMSDTETVSLYESRVFLPPLTKIA